MVGRHDHKAPASLAPARWLVTLQPPSRLLANQRALTPALSSLSVPLRDDVHLAGWLLGRNRRYTNCQSRPCTRSDLGWFINSSRQVACTTVLQFQPQCRAQFSETKVQTSCWPLSTPAHKVAGSEPDAVSPGELPVSGIGTVQSPLALHHGCDATSCVVGLSVDKTSCRNPGGFPHRYGHDPICRLRKSSCFLRLNVTRGR